jgi:hypothetical protein
MISPPRIATESPPRNRQLPIAGDMFSEGIFSIACGQDDSIVPGPPQGPSSRARSPSSLLRIITDLGQHGDWKDGLLSALSAAPTQSRRAH